MDQDAGAGGEAGEPALGSGGSEVTPQAGMPGETAGSGGDAPEPAVGGAGGGGEPVVPGEGGSGGAPSGSACGEGMYEAYETGCTACPALPDPSYPTMMSCADYHSASFDSQSKTLYLRLNSEIHEAPSGKVGVRWEDDNDMSGSGRYDFTFDPQAPNTFAIVIPDASATAQRFQITDFIFTDACGFAFNATSIPIEWFVETWSCGGPTSSCGFGSYETDDGCTTCPGEPPANPIVHGCGDFLSANYNSYDNLLDIQLGGIYEAFSGRAHLTWFADQQLGGQGDFDWTYFPNSNTFRFFVEAIPDNAQDFVISDFDFTDACGFANEILDGMAIVYEGEGYSADCGT